MIAPISEVDTYTGSQVYKYSRLPVSLSPCLLISLFTFLLEPLQYSFMVRGMAAAAMVGIVCAVVGSFVVLRGMAFFGDALAHAILPGVAVAYLIGGAGGLVF